MNNNQYGQQPQYQQQPQYGQQYPQQPQYAQQPYGQQTLPKAGTGLIIVSFLIPIVGLVLYFVKKKEVANPSAYLVAAIIGFVLCILANLML